MRKSIRLKNYNYNSNGYYFITICTAMRHPYLEQFKSEAENILQLLPERFPGLSIDYYAFLHSHMHAIFILENAEKSLSEIIRTYKALVTKTTRIKPFWEWNYYEHIIRNEKALYEIRKYIQENPLKEKMDLNQIYSRINATATNKIAQDNKK